MNFQDQTMNTNHTSTIKSNVKTKNMKLRSREDRVNFLPNTGNEFLRTVLCHEMKDLYRGVTLCGEPDKRTCRESGEQRVKKLMEFDVGRWNLLKTTLGNLVVVGIMLKTHHPETIEGWLG
jgi:hypothetical protein